MYYNSHNFAEFGIFKGKFQITFWAINDYKNRVTFDAFTPKNGHFRGIIWTLKKTFTKHVAEFELKKGFIDIIFAKRTLIATQEPIKLLLKLILQVGTIDSK